MDLGYPELTDRQFQLFASLLFRESGITLKDHKKYLLLNRLSKFVGLGKSFPDFESYYQALQGSKNPDLMVEFVNALTTNYSFFFREEIHFDFLGRFLQERQNEPYIRLWSAACSTGEEPYSMAITAMRTLQNLSSLDFRILATDISTRVLKTAESGVYHYTRVRGHLADSELKTYFKLDRQHNSFVVKDQVRSLTAFRYLNLLEKYPFTRSFDAVFLRNVLIYFDNQEKEFIINRVAETIKPGGYLVLGLSESLVGIRHNLQSMKNSIYRK